MAALVVASAAPAHVPRAGRPGDLGVRGMSERQLRQFESAVLGPEHAREHARERALIRSGEAAPRVAAPKADPVSPALGGRWRAAFPIPVIGINAVMLPTGKVMWFAYPVNANKLYGDPDAPNTAQAYLWNPANGRFKRVDPPLWRDPADGKLKPANIWCAGQTLLADGRVVVVGGNLAYSHDGKPFTGLNKVYTFDPWNETWTEQPPMAHGRWYPSVATIADGRAVIMGGLNESDTPGYNPNLGIDIFSPSGDLDGTGAIASLGDRRDLSDPPNGNPPDGGLYPHLFWMPSGRLMVAGPDTTDAWFLHYPDASFQLSSGWDSVDVNPRRRLWGSGVLVPSQTPGSASTKIELLGGTVDETPSANGDAFTGNTNTTSTFDETDGSGPWEAGASMNVNRSHLNTVLLPDGSMVSVGGGLGTTTAKNQWAVAGTERAVELFHPGPGTWTLGASQAEARSYHSTAILLPDARVISAGDDYNGGIDRDTAEIFEPPYLFNADGSYASRPRISSAPATVRYGDPPFHVGTPDNVVKAALVAPGADTHANDMNQRVVPLSLTSSTGGVDLAPPTNADVAPPGYYMLFLLNSQGVPSVARWVQVGADPPAAGRIEISQRTEPASGARFSFSGAPFDGISLVNGGIASASRPGGPSQTVPGGHYTIVQDKSSDYEITDIDCSDSDSTTSVAFRSAHVNLAAGETVRCTFWDRRRPQSSPGGSTPPATDRQGPSLRFGRLNARKGTLSGRASDTSGVKRVGVALAARSAKRCRWWSRGHRRFARRRASCLRPVFMKARLVRRRGGGYTFEVKLHRRIRRGRYLVALKAVDGRGNVTKRSGRSAVRVSIRR